jgi:hypothetical protein
MLGNTVFSFSTASPGRRLALEGGAIVHIAFFAWVAIK